MVEGIDISSYQTRVDWSQVVQSGKKFAYLRAFYGLDRDRLFTEHRNGASATEIAVGAYLFACPELSATEQAAAFAEVAVELTCPPALDLEASHGLDALAVINWAAEFVDAFESQSGRTLVVYTGPWYWNEHIRHENDPKITAERRVQYQKAANASVLLQRDLWVSNYTLATRPATVIGWSQWKLWQYLADPSPSFPHAGRCPGIAGNVDLNRFAGDANAFQVWCADHLTITR